MGARLEALGALAGLEPQALARQVVSAVDLVVHLERRRSWRGVAAVGTCVLDRDGRLEVRPVDPGGRLEVRPVDPGGR